MKGQAIGVRRISAAVVCALCCLPALFFSALPVERALSALTRPLIDAQNVVLIIGGVGVLACWTAFTMLAIAWLRHRRAHLIWTVIGTVCGLACLLLYIPFSIFALPSMGFGLTLAAQQWLRRLPNP